MKTRVISLVAVVVLAAVLALMAEDGGVSVSSAKVANTWSLEPSIPTATGRFGHVAATGVAPTGPNSADEDWMFIIGGQTAGGGISARNDGYNANTLSWAPPTQFAPLPTARQSATETVGADGRIFVIGGLVGAFPSLSTVEAYDPATNTWATLASMTTLRSDAAAATGANGKIYVFGGTNTLGGAVFSSVEEYNPANNTWISKASMPVARKAIGAELGCDNRIHVLGGGRVDIYNPANDTWTAGVAPPEGADGRAVTLGPNGLMYVINGGTNNSSATRQAWSYNPAPGIINPWREEPVPPDPMPFGRLFWAAATLDTQVYVSGGTNRFEGPTTAVQALGHLGTANPCAVGGTDCFLIGDDVEVSTGGFVTFPVTVGTGVEFPSTGLDAAGGFNIPRWKIDIAASTIRVDFLQDASYGDGASLLFGDLDPLSPGPSVVSGVTLIDSNTPAGFSLDTLDAPISFGDHFVKVQIAPSVGVVDWLDGDKFFEIELECSPAVGGIVDLRGDADSPAEAPGSSARDYTAPIAAAVTVAAVAVAAGGWYARRRWLS